MDQVIRFEAVDEGFAELARHLGLPSDKLPKVLMKNRRPESRSYYADDYDANTRAVIGDYYRDDLETFGYDFE